jgi:hypothetical protein
VEVRVVGVASDGGARLLIVAASSSTDQTPGLDFCLRHENGLSIADLT